MKTLTVNERTAMLAIRHTSNYLIGGWYNSMLDGYEEDIPDTIESAKQIVYEEAMEYAPKEIRFAGTRFCKSRIDRIFESDSDVKEIFKSL